MGVRLFDVFGNNRWCGPAALAALTGHSTDVTARVLAEVSGLQDSRDVAGVGAHEFLSAARLLGVTLSRYANYLHARPDVAALAVCGNELPDGVFVATFEQA